MAKLKSGITISTVLLSISGLTGAMAFPQKIPLHNADINKLDNLKQVYANPNEAIQAMKNAGRNDLLNGTLGNFYEKVSKNPSNDVETADWYGLLGSNCCLVVNKNSNEDDNYSLSENDIAILNNTKLEDLLKLHQSLVPIVNKNSKGNIDL